jgi:hypothetical protein
MKQKKKIFSKQLKFEILKANEKIGPSYIFTENFKLKIIEKKDSKDNTIIEEIFNKDTENLNVDEKKEKEFKIEDVLNNICKLKSTGSRELTFLYSTPDTDEEILNEIEDDKHEINIFIEQSQNFLKFLESINDKYDVETNYKVYFKSVLIRLFGEISPEILVDILEKSKGVVDYVIDEVKNHIIYLRNSKLKLNELLFLF